MNPTIAADVVRCAKQRHDQAMLHWLDLPRGCPTAQQLDRRMSREIDTICILERPDRRIPFTVLPAEPVEAGRAPVQFTNGITEDYAFDQAEAAQLHSLYQQAGVPYTVRWSPIRREHWGHDSGTGESWPEDEWLDNDPLTWTALK